MLSRFCSLIFSPKCLTTWLKLSKSRFWSTFKRFWFNFSILVHMQMLSRDYLLHILCWTKPYTPRTLWPSKLKVISIRHNKFEGSRLRFKKMFEFVFGWTSKNSWRVSFHFKNRLFRIKGGTRFISDSTAEIKSSRSLKPF